MQNLYKVATKLIKSIVPTLYQLYMNSARNSLSKLMHSWYTTFFKQSWYRVYTKLMQIWYKVDPKLCNNFVPKLIQSWNTTLNQLCLQLRIKVDTKLMLNFESTCMIYASTLYQLFINFVSKLYKDETQLCITFEPAVFNFVSKLIQSLYQLFIIFESTFNQLCIKVDTKLESSFVSTMSATLYQSWYITLYQLCIIFASILYKSWCEVGTQLCIKKHLPKSMFCNYFVSINSLFAFPRCRHCLFWGGQCSFPTCVPSLRRPTCVNSII
jgi:hypothetical protein